MPFNNRANNSDNRISFGCLPTFFEGMLFIAFLVLKLCSVIDWSWWWITAPLWAGIGLRFLLFLLLSILAVWFDHKRYQY